jgi:hypothetical protein
MENIQECLKLQFFISLYIRYGIIFIASSDAAEVWQLGSQDPATPLVEGMLHFHNYLMIF